jgi:hypothetical protein
LNLQYKGAYVASGQGGISPTKNRILLDKKPQEIKQKGHFPIKRVNYLACL